MMNDAPDQNTEGVSAEEREFVIRTGFELGQAKLIFGVRDGLYAIAEALNHLSIQWWKSNEIAQKLVQKSSVKPSPVTAETLTEIAHKLEELNERMAKLKTQLSPPIKVSVPNLDISQLGLRVGSYNCLRVWLQDDRVAVSALLDSDAGRVRGMGAWRFAEVIEKLLEAEVDPDVILKSRFFHSARSIAQNRAQRLIRQWMETPDRA